MNLFDQEEKLPLINNNTHDLEVRAIENFVSKYIVNDEPYPRLDSKRVGSSLMRAIAFIIGVTAGLPWMKTGDETAKAMNTPDFGYLINTGVIISYGATASWMLLCVTENFFKSVPSEVKEFKISDSARCRLSKDPIFHILGLITSIPAIYLGFYYNTDDAKGHTYAAMAGFLAYIYSTLGLYKLSGYLGQLRSANQVQHPLIKMLKEGVSVAKRSQRDPTRLISAIGISDGNSETENSKEFWTVMRDNSQQHAQNQKYNSLKLTCNLSLNIAPPLLNAICRTIITFRALELVGAPDELNYIATGIVVLPLLMLNIYSMNLLANLLAKMIHEKQSKVKIEPGFMAVTLPKLNYVYAIFAVIFSVLSAFTNGYVYYDQMSKTEHLNEIDWLFGLNALLLTAVLQTIGLKSVLDDVSQFTVESYNTTARLFNRKISKSEDLIGYLKKTDPKVLDAYQTKLGL